MAAATTHTPLTAAELIAHPEYDHVYWPLKPTKEATITVSRTRRLGPTAIAYELHGHGPRHILFIMGLGGLMSSWQRSTKDFGHTRGDKYTCLVLDNRGVGASGKPGALPQRYSTSELAHDVLEVLAHAGWLDADAPATRGRSIHIVGISMGGMVAQELALLIPDRIASLMLLSTAARLVSTLGVVAHLRSRIDLFVPKSLDAQVALTKLNLYPDGPYLDGPDDLAATGEVVAAPFPTVGDRIGAFEVRKRLDPAVYPRAGFISQAIAAGYHCKSGPQLRALAEKVGRARICVVHGREDRMIPFVHGPVLADGLDGAAKGTDDAVRRVFFDGVGHVVPVQCREDFTSLLEDVVAKGEDMGR